MVRGGYEVVIVDNDSTDETERLLERVDGATIIRNDENKGFLLACNAGAKVAKGKYLLFLNNDAVLLNDSVSKAVQVIEQGDGIGAVGGKILLLDGSLQEAGSLVWNDGSCLGYGRCDLPDKPEYMFRRDVDYCSGAFLMVPLALFDELGGFDPVFAPAYYEETDFCLRLHENGYKVIYEPSISILHYEFGSSQGNDATSLQKRNRKAFVANHPEYLGRKLKPMEANILKARFASQDQKKILYIDDRVPHCHFGSGFPRSNFILNTLTELGYQVTLYPLNFPNEDDWNTVYGDIPDTVEVMLHQGRKKLGEHLKSRRNYYDLVFVSRPHNMEFFSQVAGKVFGHDGWPRIIYDAEAIFSLRDAAKYAVFSGKKDEELEKNIIAETSLVDKADLVITVSPGERNTFARYYSGEIHVVGHAMELNPTDTAFNDRQDLLFIGNMDYNGSPNVDSIVWFVHEVFPLLLDKLPGIHLKLVGTNESSEIQKLGDNPQIELLGRQESLEPFYSAARVFIAPTRYAGGVPYKIHEAASYGLPVVASELLCEQLGWKSGEELLVANVQDPVKFADQCARLYSDEALWQSVREAALRRVESECSVSKMKKMVETAFDSA
ncbi:glycosyltransferase, partial [Thiolapillus sp.]